MLFGAGQIMILTKELATNGSLRGQELLYPAYLSEFELSADTSLLEAKALIDGKRQIVAAAINEETYTLRTKTEFVDWHAVQWAYDEIAANVNNVKLPTVKAAVVPSDLSLEDANITASNVDSVKVYIANRGTWGNRIFLKKVSGTPANKNEVKVTAGTITFHSSLEGAIVQYAYDQTYSSIESVGVADEYDNFGKMIFSGLAYGTEFPGKMQIVVPELSRVGKPTISIAGDITNLEIEFRASVPSGARSAFNLYDLSTGVLAS